MGPLHHPQLRLRHRLASSRRRSARVCIAPRPSAPRLGADRRWSGGRASTRLPAQRSPSGMIDGRLVAADLGTPTADREIRVTVKSGSLLEYEYGGSASHVRTPFCRLWFALTTRSGRVGWMGCGGHGPRRTGGTSGLQLAGLADCNWRDWRTATGGTGGHGLRWTGGTGGLQLAGLADTARARLAGLVDCDWRDWRTAAARARAAPARPRRSGSPR